MEGMLIKSERGLNAAENKLLTGNIIPYNGRFDMELGRVLMQNKLR